ncbi:MAG: hypothetical protein ABI763_13705 [Bacteroidota bacterium]
MLNNYNFLFAIIFLPILGYSQNQNSVWVLGDSAGIDFSNVNNPLPIGSGMDGRGSTCSISDSTGQLLFYAYNIAGNGSMTTQVMNHNHQLMESGDSIIGEGWYQEMVIVPMPDYSSKYYLFSVGLGGLATQGLYYSIIDMSLNGGLGKVILKNVQLSAEAAFDGITAVKHGNGRDWWLLFKRDGYYTIANNDFYIYFISPSGISVADTQSIGYLVSTAAGSISFNKSGGQILMTDWRNLIQTIDFDRCSGNLSNDNIIEPENNFTNYSHFRSCFSSNGEVIYLTHIPQTLMSSEHYLFQYDLQAANILASRDTIYIMNYPNDMIGLQLAPDDKIYISTWYQCNSFCFPYPDSVFNTSNMYLSVIDSPNLLGGSCGFQPNSFSLSGNRSYVGLPNNPDYSLGPLTGSGCDSLPVDVFDRPIEIPELNVYYQKSWSECFINAQGLTGKKYSLEMYNLMGQKVYEGSGNLTQSYFYREILCVKFADEIYIVILRTENEQLAKKFVKN